MKNPNEKSKDAKHPPDDPEESARFINTAKTLESDASGTAFKRALKKLIPKGKTSRKYRSGRP